MATLNIISAGAAQSAVLQDVSGQLTKMQQQLSVTQDPKQAKALNVQIKLMNLRKRAAENALKDLQAADGLGDIVASLGRNPLPDGFILRPKSDDTTGLDARNLLDLILRINDAGMVQEGEIFRIVPLKDAPRMPLRPQVNPRDIPEDDQLTLNLIFLKYVTADHLATAQHAHGLQLIRRAVPPALEAGSAHASTRER